MRLGRRACSLRRMNRQLLKRFFLSLARQPFRVKYVSTPCLQRTPLSRSRRRTYTPTGYRWSQARINSAFW
ncbi:MAG: hypothetical protein EBU32_06605 [Opitutaceae bacterium]|nr:hypothetical protein [Opitutaceae bacterium]